MDNKVNYLDIQLRDMDYRNFYSNLYDKFIDPLGFYMGEDKKQLFEQGFSKALKEAKSNLLFQSYNAQSIKNQIVVQKNGKMSFKGTEIYQMMNGQYKERLRKEQAFIEGWYSEICKNLQKKTGKDDDEIQKINGKMGKFVSKIRITELANAESSFYQGANRTDPYIERYVEYFDELIKRMSTIEDIGDVRGQKIREIIFQKIRSNQFAIEMAGGLSSAVYSTNAVSKFLKSPKSTKSVNVQQGLQEFYEDLFNVFFFNVSGGVVKGTQKGKTPTEMWILLTAGGGTGSKAAHINAQVAKKNFENKFRAFVKKYYDQIDDAELDNFFNKINTAYIDNIFKTQSGIITQRITFGEKTGGKFKYERGVSSTAQAQLKKMLEEVFKGVAKENNMSKNHYEDFNRRMQGLIRIDDRYVSNLNRNGKILCYKDLQIEIDEAKAKRNLRLELQKILKSKSISSTEKQQKLDEAYNNGQGYISKDEHTQGIVDMRHSNVAFEKEIRSKFIDLFVSKLQSCFPNNDQQIWTGKDENNKKIEITNKAVRAQIDKDKKIIKDAAFKRIEGNAKTGKLFLQAMSAYSPEAVKGLLGEISAAYELRTRGITDIQVVGSEEDSLKMQKHYDVVFSFKGNRFGMQVKNVKTSDDVVGGGVKYTLYRTELSLAEKAMYRYFSPDQVKTYRWLFANGTFLEKNGVDTVNDIKELLTVNFLAATPEFLRIRNASELNTGKSIDSDIYLIGNTFYPSSYFIYKAYKIAVQQFFENAKKGKLFKISGDFPAYIYKADPYLEISKGKYTGGLTDKDGNLTTKERSYRLNSKGKMEETKRNLVVIDDPKTRLLYGKKIIFSGVTLQL